MQLSKKQKRFWQIIIAFVNSIKIQNILKQKKKKKKSDSLRIFEIIEFEVRGYLNDKKVLFQNTLRSSLRSRFSETA